MKCDYCHAEAAINADGSHLPGTETRLVSLEPYDSRTVHLSCAERIASHMERKADAIRREARFQIYGKALT